MKGKTSSRSPAALRSARVVWLLGASALWLSGAAGAADGVPRMPDGHPDLSGTWDNGSGIDFVQPQRRGDSICVRGCEPAADKAKTSSAQPPPPNHTPHIGHIPQPARPRTTPQGSQSHSALRWRRQQRQWE